MLSRPTLVAAALALLGAALAGCATRPSGRVAWSEVEPEAPPTDPPDATSTVATRQSANRVAHATDAPPLPAPGPLIDRALQAFTSGRAQSRGSAKTSPVWTQHWHEVLHQIGEAAQLPPRASDLGGFVRARATLEVELDLDKRRGIVLPADLPERVQHVLVMVDESVGELRAANAPGTLAPSPRLDGELVLRSPLVPMVLSSPFGVRADPLTGQRRFHAGCDLDAPAGATVYASASGLVVYAGLQGGYGKHIVVDHGDAVRTHYSHLSQILVEPGQVIEEGDALGFTGSTGRSTGPHLHFAVTNENGEFLDPMGVLDVPFSVIAEQVKSSGSKRLNEEHLKLRLGSGNSVEIVDAH